MIPTWVAICAITVPCGIAFGLFLLRSEAENRGVESPFMLFGRRSLPAIVASQVVNGLLGVALFILPSGLLLRAFDLAPFHGYGNLVWVLSLLAGAAIGKAIRWLHWKKKQDFS